MGIDTSKLKEAFLSEAEAHIKTMNMALVELEKAPGNDQLFKDIFRAAHTLKSLAATMNYRQMMDLCHAMEDLLDAVRNQAFDIKKYTDLLFECFDKLSMSLKAIQEDKPEVDASHLIRELRYILTHKTAIVSENANHINTEVHVEEKIQAIEVKVGRLDILMNLAEELLVNKMKFDLIKEEIDHPELTPAIESLGRLITELQYYVLQVRLVPVGFVFNRFVRLVRDLAKQQKKQIDLQTEGSDIELDRLLIDEIGAAIGHLLRNAIDHGIETPAEREKANKPPQATIQLRASRTKETAIIEVRDDGRGLDYPSLKDQALKHHLLPASASKEELKNVIFSGLSTTKQVTQISGRGLGLSIVKQKIESIGGTIKVDSIPGKGTTFFMEIPLTLAIIKTLFVKAADEMYALPIDVVERLLVVTPEHFKGLMGSETILYENEDIPIIRLSYLFAKKNPQLDRQPIVIIRKGEDRLGLAVDSLLSTQEIVIKPLSRSVKDNQYFSGAAVVGSGQMVLIIDVAYLLSSRREVTSYAS